MFISPTIIFSNTIWISAVFMKTKVKKKKHTGEECKFQALCETSNTGSNRWFSLPQNAGLKKE